MSDVSVDGVREAFDEIDGYEVKSVEQNRSQYRVFVDAEDQLSSDDAESLLGETFGAESVFGVNVADEMWGDNDVQVRVVSFRAR